MSSRPVLLMLCLATTATAAPVAPTSVEVVAAPAIAVAPATGLDPDVLARLDAAERAIDSSAHLDELIDRVLVLYESSDPFSRAQRDAAKPRTLAILTRIGERARASGDLVIAARAFDARWTLGRGGRDGASRDGASRDGGGRDGASRDPELAQVLTTWAERDAQASPARALYLARRARTADPSHRRAAELDDDLSRNHRTLPGKLMVVAGIIALAAGIYAQTQVSAIEKDLAAHPRPGDEVERQLAARDRLDILGAGLLIAGPTISIGGVLFTLSGRPTYSPTSPGELPALGEP